MGCSLYRGFTLVTVGLRGYGFTHLLHGWVVLVVMVWDCFFGWFCEIVGFSGFVGGFGVLLGLTGFRGLV